MDADLRAFHEFNSMHMEAWDGPAGIVLTEGRHAVCLLDRNGLRPARYVITRNGYITLASEIGVWNYSPEDVIRSEEHTSELQSRENLVCRLLLEKKKKRNKK